jgi:hypothetical protein
VVLVSVLVALLLLAMALAGILAVATHEALLGRVEAATLRARLGAEGAARAVLEGWEPGAFDALPAGGRAEVPWATGMLAGGTAHAASIERLSPSRWRVVGRATAGPAARPMASASASLLLATAPPPSLWSGLAAALTSDGVVELSGSAVLEGAAAPHEPCGTDEAAVDAAGGGGPFPAVRHGSAGTVVVAAGATLDGGVLVDAGVTAARLAAGLGPLDAASAAAVASRTEAGTVALAPVAAAGECSVDAPGNWGAPGTAGHPCQSYVPVVHAPGGLELSGGAGAALLVVAGDLTVRRGTDLHGIVIVVGSLHVEEGAQLRGAVRVAGGRAEVAGTIARDACVLARTVRHSGISTRLFRPAGRWWLPSF